MRGRGPTGLWPFALPCPNAKPSSAQPHAACVKYPTILSIPLLRFMGLSGWGEASINGHLADQRLAIRQMH